jgi:hypothetical protein
MSFTPIMPTLPASSLDFSTLFGVFEATNEEICNLVRFYEDSDFPAQGSFGRIRGKPILARHGQTAIVPGQQLSVDARLIGRLDPTLWRANSIARPAASTPDNTPVGRPTVAGL